MAASQPASSSDAMPKISTRMSRVIRALGNGQAAHDEGIIEDNPPPIDLATAENWLMRPELLQICKDAISHGLEEEV